MYSYVIGVSLVCTHMSSVCHPYVLVSHLYVTCMHSFVIRMLLVCNRLSSVCHSYVLMCHSYVLVCHPYITRIYSYVIRMSLVCTRMSSVCHSYVLVCHPNVSRTWFHLEPLENKLKPLETTANFSDNPEFTETNDKTDKIYQESDSYEHREKSSKFFLDLEESRAVQNQIRNILIGNKEVNYQ